MITLEQLHQFRKAINPVYRVGDNILIVPYSDTECGKLLRQLQDLTKTEDNPDGIEYENIGKFSVEIQDGLGAKIQGSDERGVWWELPPEPKDEEPS